MLHVVQITSSAVATLQDGSNREGVIVDIDTISDLDNPDFDHWMGELSTKIDTLHQANKAMFFECLRPKTIVALEPVYE